MKLSGGDNMKWYQLDSRAGIQAALHGHGILVDEDPGRFIITVGTLKEVCAEANSGEHGDNNIVCDENFVIPWEIFNEHGHWSYKQWLKLQNE